MDCENIILEALSERLDVEDITLEGALENYTPREIFEEWLEYEGICGYTDKILAVLGQLGADTSGFDE